MTTKDFKESTLIELIRKDNTLDPKAKVTFLEMAKEYIADLEKNIYKTVFQLASAESLFSIDDWLSFTDFPIVKNYRERFTLAQSRTTIEEQLSKGTGNTSTLVTGLQRLENMRGVDDRSFLVVTRLPKKKEVDLVQRATYMRELDS